jgi:hypothetical protein
LKTEKQENRYNIYCDRNGKENIDNFIMLIKGKPWEKVTKKEASGVLCSLHSRFAWHGVKGVGGYKQYIGK